ncbi:DgyrCDS5085 [Dimorphilus gyrociliatus]|uniref:DgyrCDS5085 n=1 Tax=Dimorphilus gyrociliatus TaxID=2664684 RepID=A0A7I8VIR8_9ANNE|nr:DgyrCDS5085 [Dimorphilus gyrociliatus]
MNAAETKQFFMNSLTSTFFSAGIAIGSNLNLFDKLLQLDSPVTCNEFAIKCDLKERYIREWLGLMVSGRVISVDGSEDEDKYFLSEDQKTGIKESGKVMILTELANKFIEHSDKLISCFKPDGPRGITHETYDSNGAFDLLGKFRSLADSSAEQDAIIKQVPGLKEKLETGNYKVLEIGCNRGHNLISFAKMFPKSTFVGQDLTSEGIMEAKKMSANMENVTFSVQDACVKSETDDESFDWILTCDVIHDLPYPDKALKEAFRILKKGGYLSIVDINCHTRHSQNKDNMVAPFVYGNSLLHCLPMSYSLPDSAGLGASWGIEKAQEMFKDSGFELYGKFPMPDDFEMYYVLSK